MYPIQAISADDDEKGASCSRKKGLRRSLETFLGCGRKQPLHYESPTPLVLAADLGKLLLFGASVQFGCR